MTTLNRGHLGLRTIDTGTIYFGRQVQDPNQNIVLYADGTIVCKRIIVGGVDLADNLFYKFPSAAIQQIVPNPFAISRPVNQFGSSAAPTLNQIVK